MLIVGLPLMLTDCFTLRGVEKIKSKIATSIEGDEKACIAPDVTNPPPDDQLLDMMKEAEIVMEETLDILEKGKCYNALTNEINENKEALNLWLEKTRPTQEKIGSLLKGHPNIFCLSLCIRNWPFKEMQRYIPKNFKQFNIMWIVPSGSSSCLVIAFPTDSCVSFYGATTISENENSYDVIIENIPKYYSLRIKRGEYPNFTTEEIKGEPNDKPLLETIIEYHCPQRYEGKESKGLLISFTKKVKHKGRRFWADGIRVYSTYNYDASKEERPQLECPNNVYDKPIGTCLTFPLPAN